MNQDKRFNEQGYDRYGRAKPAPKNLKPLKNEPLSARYPKAFFWGNMILAMGIFFSRPIYEVYLTLTGQIKTVSQEEYRELVKNSRGR